MTKLKKGVVSIIIPVYNSEKYLHKCIGSIANQSYKKFEAIFVDDGSTDSSGKICDEYASRDKRIKAVHKKNSGPADARNVGIEKSAGEFIFFLDSDDFIEKDALNLLVKCYKKCGADLIIGDFQKVKNEGIENRKDVEIQDSKMMNKPELAEYAELYLKKPNKHLLFAYSWGRLFKSSIIRENNIHFNPELHTFEDVAFNFDYLKYANNAYFLKEKIYNHVIHDNYLSATMSVGGNPKHLYGFNAALDSIRKFLESRGIGLDKIRKEIGHATVCLTIIQLVRTCGQINENNKKKIVEIVRELVNDSNIMGSIQHYSPDRGESKVLPILMKLRLVYPIIWMCRYKYHKRYGKRR